MAAGGWRYIAQRLTGDGGGGEFLDMDLPLQGVSITHTLSGHDELNASISPEVARLIAPDGRPLFEKWGTAIYAENNGVIRAGTIVTDTSSEGPQFSLECIGFSGYAIDMPFTDGWYGVEVDPLDVYRKIWDHLQGQPGGNLGLEIDDLKSGLKIGTELKQVEFDTESGPVSFEAGPVKLAWHLTHNLQQEIDKLAEETPFDWRERHRWDGDQVRHFIDLGYPSLGQRRENLRFEIGVNIYEYPQVVNDEYATDVLMLGAGEGAAMKNHTASRRSGRLRRVAVVTDSSLKSKRAVRSAAEAEVAWRSGRDDIPNFRVVSHDYAPLGSFAPGDEILIQGRVPWRDEVSFWARVVSTTINPEDGDLVDIEVTRSDRLSA